MATSANFQIERTVYFVLLGTVDVGEMGGTTRLVVTAMKQLVLFLRVRARAEVARRRRGGRRREQGTGQVEYRP